MGFKRQEEEEEEETRGLWLLETAHKAFPHMIQNIYCKVYGAPN